MLKIEHVPMVHIDILKHETGYKEKVICLDVSMDAEVFYLDTTSNELKTLEKELSIIKDKVREGSMLYDPNWIEWYKNHISLINLLREKYGIYNGIYVRRS